MSVVLPEDSGPKTSTIRPRGTPPIPSAKSSDSAPVGIASQRTCAPSSPMRMTVPLPNSRSICVSAPCSAASRAFAAFSCSVTDMVKLLRVGMSRENYAALRTEHLFARGRERTHRSAHEPLQERRVRPPFVHSATCLVLRGGRRDDGCGPDRRTDGDTRPLAHAPAAPAPPVARPALRPSSVRVPGRGGRRAARTYPPPVLVRREPPGPALGRQALLQASRRPQDEEAGAETRRPGDEADARKLRRRHGARPRGERRLQLQGRLGTGLRR